MREKCGHLTGCDSLLRLPAAVPTLAEDVLELESREDDKIISEFLMSENDDDQISIPSTQVAKSGTLLVLRDEEERAKAFPAVCINL